MNRAIALALCLLLVSCYAKKPVAVDPGPRGASIDAGRPVAGLTADQLKFFLDGQARFIHQEAVSNGLGPGFNADSCGACHSQPAIGGTSPNLKAFPYVGPNPQTMVGFVAGAHNVIPDFVLHDGPVREARFIKNPDGTLDGGVHDLFSITGRSDAPGCYFAQPDFKTAEAGHNVIYRIPTPVFGGGLIEMIQDETIVANQMVNLEEKKALGIHGVPNRSGNDGTITRFGWKAQNKSLIMFSHEAYNVEIGETNQMFPNKRGSPLASCVFNTLPEDLTNIGQAGVNLPSDDDQFATFMRFLDQPTPSKPTAETIHGRAVFETVGCALCHTETLHTGESAFTGSLSDTDANLFSDLLLHRMGVGLADGIVQGNAAGDQFRTAPLWGIGQRVFFLHDGRTNDLNVAIQEHKSKHSEANRVIKRFYNLPIGDQQAVLAFLRSL
jgi:CxxC motif-containing protein (DUF1111 family)